MRPWVTDDTISTLDTRNTCDAKADATSFVLCCVPSFSVVDPLFGTGVGFRALVTFPGSSARFQPSRLRRSAVRHAGNAGQVRA